MWEAPRLTIKLDKVELERLEQGASRSFLLDEASTIRLALVKEQDDCGWETDAHEHDTEGTERPSEGGVGQEQLNETWTGKGGRDGGCSVNSQDDHTISEGSHIGESDIDDIQDAQVTNPV